MKYTGKLGRPYPYRKPLGLLASEEDRVELAKQEADEWFARLHLLFDFYQIRHGDWFTLAGVLATIHVPGMRMEKAPRGQPNKWAEIERARLRMAVEDEIRRAKPRVLKESQVIARLVKHEPWKSMLTRSTRPSDALRKQYEKADPRWTLMLRESIAFQIYEADPEKNLEAAQKAAGLDPEGVY